MTSSEFDLENFVQAAGDAIIAAGTEALIIFWNPAAERIFGYTKSEAISHSLDLIKPIAITSCAQYTPMTKTP